ncbi:hypothetical protein ACSSS7_002917 [Eimeria intestinalis]
MERVRQEAKLQIAVAGYRLAHLLSTLAKSYMRSPDQQQQQHQLHQQKWMQALLREDWTQLKRVVESSVSAFSRFAAPYIGRFDGSDQNLSNSNSSNNSSSNSTNSSNNSSSNSSNSSNSSSNSGSKDASVASSSSSLLSSLQPLPRMLLQVAGATVVSWSSSNKPAEKVGTTHSFSGARPLSKEGGPPPDKSNNREVGRKQQQEATEEKSDESNVSEL